MRGNYVFAGDYQNGLFVFDVANPAGPKMVSRYPIGSCGRPTTDGNLLFVPVGQSLVIYDATNPLSLTLKGSLPIAGFASMVAVKGNYAYVVGDSDGRGRVHVIQFNDPTKPVEIATVGSSYPATCMALGGNYLYLGLDDPGTLAIFDISTPLVPRRILDGLAVRYGRADGIVLNGELAYVSISASLNIYDISNPNDVKRINTIPNVNGRKGTLSNGYLFLNAAALDITSPRSPRLVGLSALGAFTDFAVAGRNAFGVGADGLKIVDLFHPMNPQRVGNVALSNVPLTVALQQNLALVGDALGIRVVDISDLAHPTILGNVTTVGGAKSVAVSETKAFIAAGSAGLEILDITSPANPQSIGRYDTPGTASGVSLSGSYAFVADASSLVVVDVSAPANPQRIGSVNRPAVAVSVDGTFAYIVDGIKGFEIIDVSNPASPTSTGKCWTSGPSVAVSIRHGFAYVAWNWDPFAIEPTGIDVIDLTDPAKPTVVASRSIVGSASGVAISGNYLYVCSVRSLLANSTGVLEAFDITAGANPLSVGKSFVRNGCSVAANGRAVVVTDRADGLVTLDSFRPLRLDVGLDSRGPKVKLDGPRGVPFQVQRSTNFVTWQDWMSISAGDTPGDAIDADGSRAAFFRGRSN